MSDEIEPALTADEWTAVRGHPLEWGLSELIGEMAADGEYAKAAALANDALQSTDPRQITQGDVDNLREIGKHFMLQENYGVGQYVRRLADRLAAFLPPN